MEVRADIQGIRSVAQVEATQTAARLGDVRQEIAGRLAQIAIGQRVEANVEAKLSDGSFLVKLADTAVRTNLPPGSKVGDQLQLTLLATEPRPMFKLDEAGAAPTKLSTTGKLIDNLLSAKADTALVGKTALVPNPATAPAQLAQALQTTLTTSGLFYESHLQQWTAGERPLADVMREPQNQNLSARAGVASAAAPAANGVANLVANAAADIATSSAISSTAAPTDNTTIKTAQVLHPDTAQIVNLQLNVLDQPRIQWRGEVWPGQQMDWEVREDEAAPKRPDQDEQLRSWQSVVRFDLPTLGTVAATINLNGDHVQVHVRAVDPATAATLREFGGDLSRALSAAGTQLDLLTVKQDEQA